MDYKKQIIASLLILTAALTNAQTPTQKQAEETSALESMAVVEFSTAYLRLHPDYESPLETQELMGTIVRIVDQKGYWKEVVTPQPYKAWCTDKGLVQMGKEEIEAYEDTYKAMYIGLYGQVYTKPSAESQTICDLVGGDLLRLSKNGQALTRNHKTRQAQTPNEQKSARGNSNNQKNDNQHIKDKAPKIKGRWTEVMLPSGKVGFVKSNELQFHNGFISIAQGESYPGGMPVNLKESIISQAHRLLGAPYLWGGMSAKGVDCSGLVRISAIMNGILLPRNASQMINCGESIQMDVDPSFWQEDRRESEPTVFKNQMIERTANLKRGDLVFFGTPAKDHNSRPRITHVGIYLGEGKIIHSSHCVRINSLIPGCENYYENSYRLIAAVRL